MSGIAGISVDDVTDAVENTVYTAVGLGILGFQHLQVQRRELRSRWPARCARSPTRSSAPSAAADRSPSGGCQGARRVVVDLTSQLSPLTGVGVMARELVERLAAPTTWR